MKSALLLIWVSAVRALAPENYDQNKTIEVLTNSLSRSSLNSEWCLYANAFKKRYSTREENKRKGTYLNTRKWIDYHNKLYLKGEVGFMLSVNQFSDMSLEEAIQTKTGFLKELDTSDENKNKEDNREEELLTNFELPAEVNWGKNQGAPAIKDQGGCGSCWAFSALGAIEHQLVKLGHPYNALSVQQLIDCSSAFGNQGCMGGLMTKAFNYMLKVSGVTYNSAYGYTEKAGICRQGFRDLVNITAYKRMDNSTEEAVMRVLATHGPVCVAMDATHSSAYAYSGGIYDDPYCSNTKVNHGVLLVGYGKEDNVDYWIIQNSWGTLWGENGYMRISRMDNLCGLLNLVSYPIL